MIEFGHVGWAPPFTGAAQAKDFEDRGLDICYFGDNSCFHADTFAELREAAAVTSRIKLATGITNTVTKHPSVVAGSIATVQIASGGRAICGIGKGDSAMGVIGRGPQKHAEFVENTLMVRDYLHKTPIPMNGWDSRLQWLDNFPDYTPVPLEVMGSGPRTLRAAAAFADRITLAIGTAPERIAWALDIIDKGLAEAGRSRSDIEIGAFIQVRIDDDQEQAALKLRASTKGVAHMASFPGHDLSTQPPILREATEQMRKSYDYAHHDSKEENPLNQLVSPEFAAWFGIGGPVSYAVERIGQLADAGLSYFFISDLPEDEWDAFCGQVVPQAKTSFS